MIRLVGLLAVVICGVTTDLRGIGAQEATPRAGFVPVPAECTVDRATLPDILAVLAQATPAAGVDRPVAGSAPSPLPTGQPADRATVAAVTETMRHLFACSNAGDLWGVLRLMSDELIRSIGLTPADLVEWSGQAATPVAEEDRIEAFAFTDVILLADGRVAAIIISNDPADEPALVYFVWQDGHWRYDQLVEDIGVSHFPSSRP